MWVAARFRAQRELLGKVGSFQLQDELSRAFRAHFRGCQQFQAVPDASGDARTGRYEQMFILDPPDELLEGIAHGSAGAVIDVLAPPSGYAECERRWRAALATPSDKWRRSGEDRQLERPIWLLSNAAYLASYAQIPAQGQRSERLHWLWQFLNYLSHNSDLISVPVLTAGYFYIEEYADTFRMIIQRLPLEMREAFELAIAVDQDVVWEEVAESAALLAAPLPRPPTAAR